MTSHPRCGQLSRWAFSKCKRATPRRPLRTSLGLLLLSALSTQRTARCQQCNGQQRYDARLRNRRVATGNAAVAGRAERTGAMVARCSPIEINAGDVRSDVELPESQREDDGPNEKRVVLQV